MGSVSISVPTWATKALVTVTINGSFQITNSSDTNLRLVIGTVNGRSVRRSSQSATSGPDPSWNDEITLVGTGTQTLKLQAQRAAGSGAMRVGTSSTISFIIKFMN